MAWMVGGAEPARSCSAPRSRPTWGEDGNWLRWERQSPAMKPGGVIAWWALVVACTSSGSGPATVNVSAAQACADNAHERCTRLQTCSPTDTVLRYGSESACETRETS